MTFSASRWSARAHGARRSPSTAARAGRDVTLWARDPAIVAAIAEKRADATLPRPAIDDRVAVTGAIADVAQADAVLLVVPAQAARIAATALAPHVRSGMPVIACAKGIERGTHKFMTEVIAETLPGTMPAILSGPSFAADVARGLPTAVTLACADEADRRRARASARLPHVPALSHDRRARRRDRRRGKERARDRGRHRAGPQARRERDRRAGDARLRGACALRPRTAALAPKR